MLVHSRRKHLKLLTTAGFASLLSGCGDLAARNQITLAHTLDEMHPVHLAMQRFRDELVRLSNGSLTVEIFPNAQLGTERELVELVQIGALAMTKVSSLSLENFSQDMRVFSLPYLFEDNEHYWRTLQSETGREILDSLSSVLLKGIGYYDAGARSFYMTEGPVNSPADIRGKTLRVLPSEALVQTIETFGGAAAPIAFGELYAALQQGVVQGAENNPPSLVSARHYEVANYYSLDEHVSAPDVVVMSQRVWDVLDQQQQGWVREAMDISVASQRELWRIASEEALTVLEKSGVIINRPDKLPFRNATQALRDSYAGSRVGDLAEQVAVLGRGN